MYTEDFYMIERYLNGFVFYKVRGPFTLVWQIRPSQDVKDIINQQKWRNW
jgi:hypothetical protein